MAHDRSLLLLVLAYFKLILIDAVGCGFSSYNLVYQDLRPSSYIIQCVITFIFFFDLAISIVLLYGIRKNNRALLRTFYRFSFVGFILSLLQAVYTLYSYFTVYIYAYLYFGAGWRIIYKHFQTFLSIVYFGLINIAVQVCIILLVRLRLWILPQDTTNAV